MIISDRTKYRLLEIMPGGLLWSAFVLAIFFSFVEPIYVIYFVIVFDLFWLFRVSYFVFYLLTSWRLYRREVSTPWFIELQKNHPTWTEYYHLIFFPTYREELSVIEPTFRRLLESDYDS